MGKGVAESAEKGGCVDCIRRRWGNLNFLHTGPLAGCGENMR